MATYFARKAGNINASDVWSTTPSGAASAVTFVAGDVLMANSFAITVNVSTDLGATGEVRNDTTGGATAGGSFALSNGVTLTANVIGAGGSNFVNFSGTSGQQAFIVGNITASSTGWRAVTNNSTGTLNITGNCTATNNGTPVTNNSAGTLNITGNCIGGGAANIRAAVNSSTGVMNITGICEGGSADVGAFNNGTGTMLIDGVIQASEFAAGVGGTNRQQVTLLTGPFLISPTFGVNPIACTAWRWASALNNQTYLEVGTQTLLEKRNLVTPDNATNFPTASDVRSGTAYGIGGVVFGTCAVPDPAAVALGVPVSDTVGTLASQTAEQIATAVWSAATRTITGGTVDTATTLTNSPDVPTEAEIAAAVWGSATKEITGGTVTNLTDAPASVTPADIWSYNDRQLTTASGPTAVQIRQEMDSNSTKLANLDATISSRLADADYTTPPTAAQIATAVEGSLLNEADGSAVLNAIVGAIGNTNLSEVSLVAAVRADLERNGGKLDSIPTSSAPTASTVAGAVRTELATELGRLDASVSSRLSPSGTLATVTNLTNAPASVTPADIWDYNARTLTSASGPTAVEIRQEIDANSTKLDVAVGTRLAGSSYTAPANSDITAIKVKTDALPSDPADQSLLEAAIAEVTAPSAATVASAVRSELSSELSKVSALNTERLANVATTAIVGNLIAQANS